jgi:hypothetical protein
MSEVHLKENDPHREHQSDLNQVHHVVRQKLADQERGFDKGAAMILWKVPSPFSFKKLEAKVRTMKKTPKIV